MRIRRRRFALGQRPNLVVLMSVYGVGLFVVFACADNRTATKTENSKDRPVQASDTTVQAPVADHSSDAQPPADPARASFPSNAPQPAVADPILVRGQTLFEAQCVICHGDTGDGGGKFAYLMNPRPRDFRQGNFKLATTQNGYPTDDDLLRTISRRMPGSAMPP